MNDLPLSDSGRFPAETTTAKENPDPVLDLLMANRDLNRTKADELLERGSQDSLFREAALRAVAADFMVSIYVEGSMMEPLKKQRDAINASRGKSDIATHVAASKTIAENPVPDAEGGRKAVIAALEKLQSWVRNNYKGKINFTPTEMRAYDVALHSEQNRATEFVAELARGSEYNKIEGRKKRLPLLLTTVGVSGITAILSGNRLFSKHNEAVANRPAPDVSSLVDQLQPSLTAQQKLAADPDAWKAANIDSTQKTWTDEQQKLGRTVNAIKDAHEVPYDMPLRQTMMISGLIAGLATAHLKGVAKKHIQDHQFRDAILPQLAEASSIIAQYISRDKLVTQDGPAR